MSSLVINGGKKLAGTIRVAGMKNAVVALMPACLLTEEECVLENVPAIRDIDALIKIFHELGVAAERRGESIKINAKNLRSGEPDRELTRKIRASVLLMGPLLARFRSVRMSYPGGDVIGARPIDTHLAGFAKLGALVRENHSDVSINAQKLMGSTIVLTESSVTATENIMMAATLAEGTTVIKLAAMEPHVQDLAVFLNKMGAKISGHGSPTITIEGVKKLHGATHKIIPDQVEAGTFACLAAATRSEIEIQDIEPDHLDAEFVLLEEMGVEFEVGHTNLYIKRPKELYKAAVIQTGLYPKLASDLQAPFGVLATQAKGTSLVHDWMYEGRLGYINELIKMGANAIIADPHRALITGPTPLFGTEINSLDIRAGITLVIAGLVAEGKTIINDAEHIDRGYEKIEERLQKLGADVRRIGKDADAPAVRH